MKILSLSPCYQDDKEETRAAWSLFAVLPGLRDGRDESIKKPNVQSILELTATGASLKSLLCLHAFQTVCAATWLWKLRHSV